LSSIAASGVLTVLGLIAAISIRATDSERNASCPLRLWTNAVASNDDVNTKGPALLPAEEEKIVRRVAAQCQQPVDGR
jgi:hypothetical protein